jgi:uncharacterized protein YbbC (DUF1343 family)/CubicO group peptidase (beta-lactamase class C family)
MKPHVGRGFPRLLPAIALFLSAILQGPPVRGQEGTARPSPARQKPTSRGAAPAAPQISTARLAQIDRLIVEALAEKKLPGAVVLIGHRGGIAYHKAFGDRAIVPAVEPMTTDTIFDLASLTKVFTATSVMILVEEGRLRLNDRVSAYIRGFEKYDKQDITLGHLLAHTSGLRPDLDLEDGWAGPEIAIERAIEEVPLARPNERFIYSDINYVVLGDVVARVSGQTLDRFASERIFKPLGMTDTTFKPSQALVRRIAPSERCGAPDFPCVPGEPDLLRGIVHDPTARRMGGVAGHAGVFGTAADLARFCQMLLAGGASAGARILSPLGVARMTSPATPPGMRAVRSLGWDIDSVYSSNRGDLFPIGSFGHTGFTGTSIWIDPSSDTFVIFLSSRLHPDGKGDVTALRAKVATAAAAAITDIDPARLRERSIVRPDTAPASGGPTAPDSPRDTLPGVDVWSADSFATLRGKRVGLLTNHTGRSRKGESTIDLLAQARDVRLVALFSPEHGIRGLVDDKVHASRDEKTGLPVHSLYGDTLRPTPAMLEGLDILVVDLQDIGTRFYTYISTMGYVLEEAAKRRIAVTVLDRPNPINGFAIEGPVSDPEVKGFTSYFPMPVRHGLTIGELARLFNAEQGLGANLTVVPMKGWRRGDWFDDTGLQWVNPSPNMRNLIAATLYPGIGAIEGTNVSVGRGTDRPFEQIGAPWIDGIRLAGDLNQRRLPGITFYPTSFTPSSSKYAGELCQGVFMIVTDRNALKPVRLGVEVAAALNRLYGDRYDLDAALTLLGSRASLARIRAGEDPESIAVSWEADEARWRLMRAKYLLY